MSRTALVNARTPNAVPEEQFQGTYQFTPPEVLAYLRGEQLSAADLALVDNHFNGERPVVAHSIASKSPEDYPQAMAKAALAGQTVKLTQRRLVAKRTAGTDTPSPDTLAASFVSDFIQLCNDDLAYSYLQTLAKRFEMEIE